jgi:hypothetical protein
VRSKERYLQNILFENLVEKTNKLIVPNVKLYWWESDLISVSNSDLVTEIEIKSSRQDFLQDFKKKKHSYFIKNRIDKIPSYFYYAVDSHILKLKELPRYAGLIYVKSNKIKIIKRASRLHNLRIDKRRREYLERGLMFRYWKLRKSKKGR